MNRLIPILFALGVSALVVMTANRAEAITYAYIPSYGDDTVLRIRTSDAATISLDISTALSSGGTCSPYGVAVAPDGSAVLVTCETHDSVLRITNADFSSGAYSRTPLSVGTAPLGVAIAPTGDYAYVANHDDNTVSKINLTTFQVVGGPTDVGQGPWGIAAIYDEPSDVTRVYVANYFDGSISVINDSAADGISIDEITGVGSGPTGVTASPDGRYIYVANQISANVAVLRTSDSTVIGRIGVSGDPWGVAVGSIGSYLYVSNNNSNTLTVIDTADMAIHATYPVGAWQFGVAAPRNGDFAFVVSGDIGDTIRKVDLAAGRIEEVVNGETVDAIALGNFIGGAPPAAPSGLSGSATSDDHIDLTWNDNSSDESGFKLERRVAGESAFVEIARLSADRASYSDTRVNDETAYEYRIRSYNEAADSDYSSTSAEITTPDGSDFSWCFIGTLLQIGS